MQSQGISQRLLCQGICSEFTLSYYLDGKRSPDPLTFITLLQRLKLSTNMFVIFLSDAEYAYFQQRALLLKTITHSDWKQVQQSLFALRQTTTLKSPLEKQFLLIIQGILTIELDNNLNKGIHYFTEAICLTKIDFSFEVLSTNPNYMFHFMSNQEWCALLNLLWALKASKLDSVIILLEQCIYQLEQYSLDELQQVNVYSSIAYLLATCYFEKHQYTTCEYWCQKTIALLYKHNCLENLINLLHCNISCKKMLAKTEEMLQEQCKLTALQRILPTDFSESKWVLSPMLELETNVFIYRNFLSKKRKQMNFSQEELCANICSSRTLRNFESGRRITHKYILQQLFYRLQIPIFNFSNEIITTDIRLLVLHQKMKRCLFSNNILELENYLFDLKANLDKSFLLNQQWLFLFQSIVDYSKGVLNNNTYRINIEFYLRQTFPNLDFSQIPNYYLTPLEVLLFLQLAKGYEYEHDFVSAIHILESLNLHYKNQEMLQEFQDEYIILVQIELIKCYKEIQIYEPILHIADSIIQRQTCNHRINFIPNIIKEIALAHTKLGNISEAEEYSSIISLLDSLLGTC